MERRCRNPCMYYQEKSDSPIVPEKAPNKHSDNKPCAEAVEERGGLVRNAKQGGMYRTQSWTSSRGESLWEACHTACCACEELLNGIRVSETLSAIYEVDFYGFSYGFRPERGCHNALDVLYVAIMKKQVNYVLDADIQGFFNSIPHTWMRRFLEYRIADTAFVLGWYGHVSGFLNIGTGRDNCPVNLLDSEQSFR